jgi:hypothetical protein
MAAYRINGPTLIGDTGKQSELLGSLKLTDTSTTQGSVFFVSSAGILTGLSPGTAGQYLTTNGAAANPTWTTSPANVSDSAFVFKSGTQTIGPGPTAATTITTFTAAPTQPQYNTGGLNATTGVITAAATSKYRIHASIAFTNTSAAGTRILSIRRNGVSFAQKTLQPTGDTSANQQIDLNVSPSLTAADTIDFQFATVGIDALGNAVIQAGPESWIEFDRFVG